MTEVYHVETSPLIYSANQWTGVYKIGTSVMKELNQSIWSPTAEAHLELCRTYLMELFAKIVNTKERLPFFAKKFHHRCVAGT